MIPVKLGVFDTEFNSTSNQTNYIVNTDGEGIIELFNSTRVFLHLINTESNQITFFCSSFDVQHK
jgi:hypothetical protein